ncbi:MAG: DUF3368 domain-containing protein [Proteobacteria bacterium]|nr:DUF3368 domain-containing protein [Pseudomonadota bacterium]
MPNIISNSSCLIALDNIGQTQILKDIYGKIYITEEVAGEVGIDAENWIEIKQVKNSNYTKMLTTLVDVGEASTLALSFEFDDSILILDDLKARKLAEKLNLKYTGLLGVLLKAKKAGAVDSVRDVLKQMKSAGFRISDRIEREVLKLADE